MPAPHHSVTLVPAHLGSPGQRAVKRVSVLCQQLNLTLHIVVDDGKQRKRQCNVYITKYRRNHHTTFTNVTRLDRRPSEHSLQVTTIFT